MSQRPCATVCPPVRLPNELAHPLDFAGFKLRHSTKPQGSERYPVQPLESQEAVCRGIKLCLQVTLPHTHNRHYSQQTILEGNMMDDQSPGIDTTEWSFERISQTFDIRRILLSD